MIFYPSLSQWRSHCWPNTCSNPGPHRFTNNDSNSSNNSSGKLNLHTHCKSVLQDVTNHLSHQLDCFTIQELENHKNQENMTQHLNASLIQESRQCGTDSVTPILTKSRTSGMTVNKLDAMATKKLQDKQQEELRCFDANEVFTM